MIKIGEYVSALHLNPTSQPIINVSCAIWENIGILYLVLARVVNLSIPITMIYKNVSALILRHRRILVETAWFAGIHLTSTKVIKDVSAAPITIIMTKHKKNVYVVHME